mgnify:CR=1 FL=1
MIHLLKTQTRTSDFLGRMADDRLLAIVPHTDLDGARAMSTRILDEVSRLEFSDEGRSMRVSVSLGIAQAGGENTLFYDAMLQQAAEALEEAMAAGGGRYVVKAVTSAVG